MHTHIGRSGAIAAALAALGLTACSTVDTGTQSAIVSPYTAEELQARNDQLLAREAELARREAEIQDAQFAASNAMDDLLPPDGQPGECYARVWVEPSYRTETETVLVKEGSTRIEIIPAQYQTVSETVLVSEASTTLETIPATYRTVTEEKLVNAGGLQWKLDITASAAAS